MQVIQNWNFYLYLTFLSNLEFGPNISSPRNEADTQPCHYGA